MVCEFRSAVNPGHTGSGPHHQLSSNGYFRHPSDATTKLQPLTIRSPLACSSGIGPIVTVTGSTPGCFIRWMASGRCRASFAPPGPSKDLAGPAVGAVRADAPSGLVNTPQFGLRSEGELYQFVRFGLASVRRYDKSWVSKRAPCTVSPIFAGKGVAPRVESGDKVSGTSL